jgi:predicted transcriptional regulator
MPSPQTLKSLTDIPPDAPAFLDVVILRLLNALAAPTKTEAMKLAPQLSELINRRLRTLSPAVRKALLKPHPADAASLEITEVYRLGQLTCVQNMFYTVVGKRLEDDTLALIRSVRYRKYLRILRKEDLSAEKAATTLAVSVRTVKKRYGELIQAGAVDRQVEGKNTVFLLTQLGHEVYAMCLHKKKQTPNPLG